MGFGVEVRHSRKFGIDIERGVSPVDVTVGIIGGPALFQHLRFGFRFLLGFSLGFRFLVSAPAFRVSGLGLEFRVQGLGFRV